MEEIPERRFKMEHREAYALTLAKTTPVDVLQMALKFAEDMQKDRREELEREQVAPV